MNTNVDNPSRLKFVSNGGDYAFAGGAGSQWVDTDCSANLGTDVSKVFVFQAMVAFGSNLTIGARAHGSAGTIVGVYAGVVLSHVNPAGHIDFYQDNAGAITYKCIGYLKLGV